MLNSRDKNDKTPLHYAATNGNLQVRRFAPGITSVLFSFKKLGHSDITTEKYSDQIKVAMPSCNHRNRFCFLASITFPRENS